MENVRSQRASTRDRVRDVTFNTGREQTAPGLPPTGLVWLETNSCDGHVISFLNTCRPGLREVLEKHFHMYYNSFIMPAQGENATRLWSLPEVQSGDFILVVEGTVPMAYGGRTSVIGKEMGRDVTAKELVSRLGSLAREVVAAGTCSSFGGPYAAWPNPTGSLPISRVLNRRVIKVPGCPVNPGWIMETLFRLRLGQEMELDSMDRPRFLYGTTVHSLCERLPFFEAGRFAEKPGDSACLYMQGCRGPVTRADCPERRWIEERSGWPVGVNSPCIGCTAPGFPDLMSPLFQRHTDLYSRAGKINLGKLGAVAAVMTALEIGAHFTGKIITGRFDLKLPGLSGKGGPLSRLFKRKK